MKTVAVGELPPRRSRKAITPALAWTTAAGTPITGEILEWPPDLFALTEIILGRSEVYRLAISPPAGASWPPDRCPNWSDMVEEAGRCWSASIMDRQGDMPDLLRDEWGVFEERAEMSLDDLAEGRDWRMCEALLTLHAIADEACAGLATAADRADGKGCLYRARARELLARTGSLSRISTDFLRVLPKTRTPPNGTSLRSFSRYVSMDRSSVEARWHKMPVRRTGTNTQARRANVLLLPWPLQVRTSDFRAVEGSVERSAKEPFGLFEFAPQERLDLDLVARLIVAAREEAGNVDSVMLPEAAIDERDINDLEAVLDRHGVVMLITGVRQASTRPGQLLGNWVHLGFSPRLEKGGALPNSTGEQWFHIRQNKHNRWSLDETQILQYHLGGALHPDIRWWEAMDVPRRTLQFIEHGDEITLISLVCEDLARMDDVAAMIHSVGPTVIFVPLLDGPQLNSRWSARYASVFADDPGSTVLTLSSFGMVRRSRPHGRDSSSVVGLWKDPVTGAHEIPLEAGAEGVLLSVCGSPTSRRTADGRFPVDNATNYFSVSVGQVRASSVNSGPSTSTIAPLAPRLLECDELTVLTGWAEAAAEMLACAPERVDAVLADARQGSAWRAALEIAEPSPQLSKAIHSIGRVIREATPQGGVPILDALHFPSQEDERSEDSLDRLARRVLRMAIEGLRIRRASEVRSGIQGRSPIRPPR